MAALPFIFLTNECHVISPIALQQSQPPSNIQIGKYFFKPQVEDIKMEFFKVKSMGSGTAEEWLKGLDDRGKERKADASRWERWEAAGGVQRMRSDELAENQGAIINPTVQSLISLSARPDGMAPAPPFGLSKNSSYHQRL